MVPLKRHESCHMSYGLDHFLVTEPFSKWLYVCLSSRYDVCNWLIYQLFRSGFGKTFVLNTVLIDNLSLFSNVTHSRSSMHLILFAEWHKLFDQVAYFPFTFRRLVAPIELVFEHLAWSKSWMPVLLFSCADGLLHPLEDPMRDVRWLDRI